MRFQETEKCPCTGYREDWLFQGIMKTGRDEIRFSTMVDVRKRVAHKVANAYHRLVYLQIQMTDKSVWMACPKKTVITTHIVDVDNEEI